MPRDAVPIEEVIAAYRATGSVWRAAKRLHLSGQAVWERLRGIGYPMRGANWTADEIEELTRLVGDHTLTQISHALGRPYGGVACKISQLGLAGRSHRREKKLPRGAGYDKATTLRRLREFGRFSGSLRQFCRAEGIHLDPFIKAVQRHAPDWWAAYSRERSDLAEAVCPNCGASYYPMTKKQTTCTRRCQSQLRRDLAYYGGKRRQTIGLAEGICQLCLEPKEKLSSHHLRGKENDPENEYLIALCSGCHQLVGTLAGRRFADSAEGWENLINLVMLRRLGARDDVAGVHTCVDLEFLSADEIFEDEETQETLVA